MLSYFKSNAPVETADDGSVLTGDYTLETQEGKGDEKEDDEEEEQEQKQGGFFSLFSGKKEEYIEPPMPYMGPPSKYNQVVERIKRTKPGKNFAK
jgi:hypothetical protein